MLEKAFQLRKYHKNSRVKEDQLHEILINYMIQWLLADDEETAKRAMKKPAILEQNYPHWSMIVSFVQGQIRALDFERTRAPKGVSGLSQMTRTYSFDDAHEVVGSVSKTFASFWESECRTMKDSLVAMDESGTGRVKLSRFYGTGISEESRFGESEAYLRDLGVLDETSAWRGKEVRIANYMQAHSNCIVAAPNYLVCCKNECEDIIGTLDDTLGAPTATPSDIIRVLRNVSSPSSEEDEPPAFDGPLKDQLEKLGELHGGNVPLHGRLFSQWLHYAYPRECAFPHKAGTHKALTPSEYGGNYIATDAEMRVHAESTPNSPKEDADEERWISQEWSEEEEVLLAGHAALLRAPWESRRTRATIAGIITIPLLGAFVAVSWRELVSWRERNDKMTLPSYDSFGKSHLV